MKLFHKTQKDDLEIISNINTNISNKIEEINLEFDKKERNVENIIKLNDTNFNENDYQKEEVDGLYIATKDTKTNENVSTYINYYLKIGDFVTNSGYTVILDKDGNIKKINDNTIDSAYSVSKTQKNDNNFKIAETDTEKYLNKSKSDIADTSNIQDEKVSFYYDLIKDQKYAYVTLTFSDSSTQTFTYEM